MLLLLVIIAGASSTSHDRLYILKGYTFVSLNFVFFCWDRRLHSKGNLCKGKGKILCIRENGRTGNRRKGKESSGNGWKEWDSEVRGRAT